MKICSTFQLAETACKNLHRYSAAGEESPYLQKTLKNEILHYIQDDVNASLQKFLNSFHFLLDR